MAYGTEPLDASLVPISSVYNLAGNTFPALQGEPGGYYDSNSNTSSAVVMSFLRPRISQSAHNVTGSAGKTLTCAFNNNNIAGNSIVACVGMGEVEGANITLTVTDTLGNTYIQAGNPAQQSTTLEATIFYSVGQNDGKGIAAGANTVTVTIAGTSSTNTAIGVQIYEVSGLIAEPGTLDATNTGSNAGSTNVSTGAVVPAVPNELVFMAIAAAGGTITAGTNWTLDSTSLSPTGGNLVSFGAQSRLRSQITSLTPSATLSTSNAWAACCATFKSVIVPIEGTVNVGQINGVTPRLDNTNLGVSTYVKTSSAGDTALTLAQATMANSLPVTMASDQTPKVTGTSTKTSVAAAASDTALLASNSSRKGATFFNDGGAIMYLSYGSGAASTSSYTVQVPANGYFELPPEPIYTGAIRAIWSSATGNVRITELS